MRNRFSLPFFFCGLLLSTLPVRAQLAFAPLATTAEVDISHGPDETPTYKLVHGVVQDKRGALPGATVWLRGSRTIVVANAEGEFELLVPANAKVVELTCSYGGLEDETVRLAPVQFLGSLYLLRTKNMPVE